MAEDGDDRETSEEQGSFFEELLCNHAPTHAHVVVKDAFTFDAYDNKILRRPTLLLNCENCGGDRIFDAPGSRNENTVIGTKIIRRHLSYICNNCRKFEKVYSLEIVPSEGEMTTKVFKFGEFPPYGLPTPSRLLRMLNENRNLFLLGRRCENQGMGIGAFIYYRRVIENQRKKLIDEVIKVAKKVRPDFVTSLEKAAEEIQFSKSMEMVKDVVPESLFIDGRNPLSLLHSAFSVGVHDMSDEECLAFARDARAVMSELAERISLALKDEAELNAAVQRLGAVRSHKKA